MRIILLGGGMGKRLWPLSNEIRSKIFLKLLPAGNGERESMIQRVWRQLNRTGLAKTAHVAVNRSQLGILRSQLGDNIPVIVEPERKDTFAAVALAVAYLHSVCGAEAEEVVCVLPADAYVDHDFFDWIKKLDRIVPDSGAELAVIGVTPTYPSAEYGYIIPENPQDEGEGYWKVAKFTEKPGVRQACAYMEQKALWNCGVFAFKLKYATDWLKQSGYPLQYERLIREYDRLPTVSFDHQIAERTRSMVVLPFAGRWKDLGTWLTLSDELDARLIGNGIISEDSRNTNLVNELPLPVAVLGLSDVIVASGPEGILVAKKAASPGIKEMMKRFEAERESGDVRRG